MQARCHILHAVKHNVGGPGYGDVPMVIGASKSVLCLHGLILLVCMQAS